MGSLNLNRQNIKPLIVKPIIRVDIMDNSSIVVDDWIRALKTMDPIRSQVNIENIEENFQLFNPEDQRSIILSFLHNIQKENSEIFIKNYISCLSTLNQTSIVSSLDLLKNTVNPLISKYLLESTINRIPRSQEKMDALISHCISEPFSALFSYTISIITENLLYEYVSSVNKLYSNQASILIKHHDGKYSLSAMEYNTLLENILSLLNALYHFGIDNAEKYQQILSFLCTEDIHSLYDPKKKKLTKIVAQLFLNIAVLGDYKSFLVSQFRFESREQIRVAILHKLSEIPKEMKSGCVLPFLKEIAEDDNYFAFAVASMVKIGGEDVKQYVLNEVRSDKYRRVFFTSYFLPYLDLPPDTYDEIIQNLLTYKQPLILKQALWVVRKKKLSNYVNRAIKLLFHDNEQVSSEAQKVLLEVPDSIELLEKAVNYYGPDKKEVISHLITRLRKLS